MPALANPVDDKARLLEEEQKRLAEEKARQVSARSRLVLRVAELACRAGSRGEAQEGRVQEETGREGLALEVISVLLFLSLCHVTASRQGVRRGVDALARMASGSSIVVFMAGEKSLWPVADVAADVGLRAAADGSARFNAMTTHAVKAFLYHTPNVPVSERWLSRCCSLTVLRCRWGCCA